MTEDSKPTAEGQVEAAQGPGTAPAGEPKLRLAETAITQAAATPRPLDRPPDLHIVRRGYDVAATDAFLTRLEKSFHELTTERDALKQQVGDLEKELVEYQAHKDAIAEALITAQTLANEVRARAEAEVEGDRVAAAAAKSSAEIEADQIRADAHDQARALIAEAKLQSAKLVDQMQEDVRTKQHEAENILDDAKARVESLVHELLERLPAEQAQPEA